MSRCIDIALYDMDYTKPLSNLEYNKIYVNCYYLQIKEFKLA